MKIRILNPVPGGATYIGLERAHRYVKSGRAILTGSTLRFLESHHGHQAAQASARHTDGGYKHAANSGIASAKQLAGIPVVNGRELIAPKGKFTPRPLFMRAADVNGQGSSI